MTIEERKRAKLLEQTSRIYSQSGRAFEFIAITSIVVIISDIALVCSGLGDNNMLAVMPAHNLILYGIMGLFSMVSTSTMGDNSTVMNSSYNYEAKYGSTIFTGRFLAALPFSARDSLNLRLINWEKQLAASTVITSALQAAMLIAENHGYEVNHNINGLCVVGFIGAETALMFISTAWHLKYATLPAAFGAAFVVSPFMNGEIGGYEKLSESAEGLSALSGVNGIIVTIAFAVLLAVGAEIWTKHRKNISWNMN